MLFIAMIASGAFVLGMVARPWNSSAAPAGTIEACVNKYTGAVRMSPYGTVTCNSNETQVVWPAGTPSTTYVVRTEELSIPANTLINADVACNSGEIAISGGVYGANDIEIWGSAPEKPVGPPTQWLARVHNPTTELRSASVRVVCASVSP
ncbi:MAG: hypothetical protein R2849_09880 [Thermomicrobiales bacterium]